MESTTSHSPRVNIPGSLLCTVPFGREQVQSLETQLTEEVFTKCHPQTQSPLFQLPVELRRMIFLYATAPHLDPRYRHNVVGFCDRPGHEGKYTSSTTLLLTCRRAWLDAHAMPMIQAKHTFWIMSREDRPAWTTTHQGEDDLGRFLTFLSGLTLLNRRYLSHVHVFAQFYLVERPHERLVAAVQYLRGASVLPHTFTLTIRSSDLIRRFEMMRHAQWWYCKNRRRPKMTPMWLMPVLDSLVKLNVERFVLELEVPAFPSYKVEELLPVAERTRSLEVAICEGPRLVSRLPAKEITSSTPNAPRSSRPPVGFAQNLNLTELNCRVFALTWRREAGTGETRR